jgi:peptidoglycan/xylan/chitin deacetylase (PgdA/CDA1 family)
MYHGIRDGVGSRHAYFETNTSPALFSRQMQFLRDHKYNTLDLGEAVKALSGGDGGRRQVVITFDDGYRDFYTNALPILAKHSFKATVFIVSGLIDKQLASKIERQVMTWDEVREVHSNGIDVGSHTATHPQLYRLKSSLLENEIRQSKRTIEDTLGEAVRSFSYPFAFPEHDRKFIRTLRDLLTMHGYENGVSTIIGTAGRNHDRFFLPRLPVNSYDDPPLFQAKLEGGYDWLHYPQNFYKRLKGNVALRAIRGRE